MRLFLLTVLPFSGAFVLPSSHRSSCLNALQRLEDSAVSLKIDVPGTATKASFDKVCRELSKNANIPGFRKGSTIPPKILQQTLSSKAGPYALETQAINELLATLVEPALSAENVQPIGQPSPIVPAEELAKTFTPGEEMELEIRCDVWPEIEWTGERPYVGLKGEYRRPPVDESKLEAALNDLKERFAKLEPITDENHVLVMGNACKVNMQGYMAENGEKGEALPNAASGDNVEVILGQGRYMEGLVEGVLGSKVGDMVQVSVNFPDKLRDKNLAGKAAIFDVTILEASERKVPELTDEFANQVRAGLTKDALLDELKKAVDQEDAKQYTPARNKALAEALAGVIQVEVPDTLVTNQAREKFALMMSDFRDNGVSDEEIQRQINPENFEKYKQIAKPDIIKDFKVSMAADEIARLEQIEVPDYQIEEQMANIRKDAEQAKEDFDEALIRDKVVNTMTRQAVFDWLAEQGDLTVHYGEEEFDEKLMEQLAEESLEREKANMAAEAVQEESAQDAEIVVDEVPVEGKEEVEAVTATATEESEEAKKERYASLPLGDRAFEILKDLDSSK